MNRRRRADAIIVGGGVVGAACALALSRLELDVALVEARRPDDWSPGMPDLRVYAFAPDNAALLDGLGVWGQVLDSRAQPYRSMRVWDAAGGGELAFEADALGRAELGWIVEHGLLVDRLWQALSRSDVRLCCPASVESLHQDDRGVELRLDDGTRVAGTLAVAADGAQSTLRRLAGIDVSGRDYGQRGVVGYVATELPHQSTAWQRFLPTGPLALLPCADGSCSIVWTLPQDDADRVLALDDAAFATAVTEAFAARLGEVTPRSRRIAFPLRRQLAETFVSGRVLVLGDAAHVVHPLAGQGVNLGLRDVSALVAEIERARSLHVDWHAPQRLRRWARGRRSETVIAGYAFDAINRAFSNDALLPTVLRGPLLGLAGRFPPLTRGLWRRAAGM